MNKPAIKSPHLILHSSIFTIAVEVKPVVAISEIKCLYKI